MLSMDGFCKLLSKQHCQAAPPQKQTFAIHKNGIAGSVTWMNWAKGSCRQQPLAGPVGSWWKDSSLKPSFPTPQKYYRGTKIFLRIHIDKDIFFACAKLWFYTIFLLLLYLTTAISLLSSVHLKRQIGHKTEFAKGFKLCLGCMAAVLSRCFIMKFLFCTLGKALIIFLILLPPFSLNPFFSPLKHHSLT